MVAVITQKENLSERVRREKEALLSAPPQIDTDRIRLMLQVYREYEHEPVIMRRARLFYRLCSEKSIYIDNNPIVGTVSKYKYGSYPLPEVGCRWMARAKGLPLQRGVAPVTPEVAEDIERSVGFWEKANLFSRTKEIILGSLGVDIGTLGKCGVGLELTPGSVMSVAPDFAKVLNQGLLGIRAEIEHEKANLDIGAPDGISKWYFYQAASICLEGMMVLAKRYVSLAREMAAAERDPQRKQELDRIAEICERVPAHPARNFQEAIQSFWFTILGVHIEAPQIGTSPPCHLTKSLYPFYHKDREEGRIRDEEVIELLQFFFLKINGLAGIQAPHGLAFNQSRLAMQLNLGGLTPDGEDATNGLDWLVLAAQKGVRLPEPLVNLVYHDKLSEDFLLECVELIRTGVGQPAFHNATVTIQRHLYHQKMPLEEARNFAIFGCVQATIPGCTDGYYEARLNVAKLLELALNNGKDSLTGIETGPRTGEAENFKTYDEFHQALVGQMKYFIPLMRNISRVAYNVARDFPVPFGSALTNDCIKKGKDVVDGGARYGWGDGVTFIGVIDVANSLSAIKKLVYEEKRLTIKQLKEALAADFVGYEEIQRLCLSAPKYGNDDWSVDSIAKEVYDICAREHQKYPDYLGRPVQPAAYSVTSHFAAGRFTGALPNGRNARRALCDASVSAQPGTDTKGPTSLMKSAARVVDTVVFNSNHLNMKFHPTALKGPDAARKLLSLIKTYFDLGGYHVQFNCVSSETLKDAQLHPENYRDLIVRVAGFSAYFIHLDKEVQNEIIRRTEIFL